MLFWGATGSRTVGIVFLKPVACVTVFAREEHIHVMPRERFAVRNDQTACINKWLTGD